MTCAACQYSIDGHVGPDCPMRRIGVPLTFKGGCNLAMVRQQAKDDEAARVARLPDIPSYPASEVKMERDLQRLCEQELSRRGIVYLHLSPKAREKIGWPDLVFCVAGRPMAIELKGPRGKLSDDQKVMLGGLTANGWKIAICRTFDEFKAVLE